MKKFYPYVCIFQDIEDGPIQSWKTKPAPELAVRYWALPVRLCFTFYLQSGNLLTIKKTTFTNICMKYKTINILRVFYDHQF